MSDKKDEKNSTAAETNTNVTNNNVKGDVASKVNAKAEISPNISYSTSSSSQTTEKTTPSKSPDNTKKKHTDVSSPENKKANTAMTKTTESKTTESKDAAPKTTKAKSATVKKATTVKVSTPNKGAKITAAIAIILAFISILASVGHYFWQKQQTDAQLLALSQENQQAIKQSVQQSQAQLKRALTSEFNQKLSQQLNQQTQANSQSQQSAQKAQSATDDKLQLLTAQIKQLEGQVSQRDPSDWLVHEAEYLVRIAARTMWLERDTAAAINLLRDADSRLKELNRPKFLPVRALINEDIENLALMPALTNEEAILTLMALNKQVPNLTLAGVNLTEALDEVEEDFVLSDDLSDWKENLARTWKEFIKDFITVRRRTGMVEPLMAPEQQQHLKQNLSLKIQLVQWAASEQKQDIYQQTLLDIQQWLNEFFDMKLNQNKLFYSAIENLKKQTIYYDYPSDLRSLSLLKRLLADTKQGKQVERIQAPESATSDTPVVPKETTSNEAETLNINNEKASGGTL